VGEFFVRSIPVAGEHFTQEIKRQLQVDYLQAESLKREAEGLIPVIAQPLHTMVLEIRRTLTFYRNQLGIKEFDRLVVTGGSAPLEGLVDHLQNELKIEVSIFDPLRLLRISDPVAVKTLRPYASQFATAIGLVVRGE
jgi:type IV pilus assembly protein PilM